MVLLIITLFYTRICFYLRYFSLKDTLGLLDRVSLYIWLSVFERFLVTSLEFSGFLRLFIAHNIIFTHFHWGFIWRIMTHMYLRSSTLGMLSLDSLIPSPLIEKLSPVQKTAGTSNELDTQSMVKVL